MTNLPTSTALAFAILFFATTAFSQDYYASADTGDKSEKISTVYRLHKKLPAFHNGYVIELATSEFPIKKDHPIFKKFGKVFYHKLREGGYSYVIKANFAELKSAKNFCDNIIKPRYENARVYEYKKGVRKLKK